MRKLLAVAVGFLVLVVASFAACHLISLATFLFAGTAVLFSQGRTINPFARRKI